MAGQVVVNSQKSVVMVRRVLCGSALEAVAWWITSLSRMYSTSIVGVSNATLTESGSTEHGH